MVPVDLRSKLARLTKPQQAAQAPARVETSPSQPPAHIADLRARLAQLIDRGKVRDEQKRRERMAEIAARAAHEETALPFELVDTPHGPLHVRTVRHPPASRVGRTPIAPARRIARDSLGVLALDRALDGLDPARALYVDTESTGLAGGTGTVPFLVGLGAFDDEGGFVVEQLLLRQLGEETPMLAHFASRVAAASMVVTFNGKAFDFPLLRTRFVMNRMKPPSEPPHFDLVHVARRIHRAARGGVRAPVTDRGGPWIERVGDDGAARALSCKLVAIEEQILGFVRVDDVPSCEIPARYGHFLRSGDGAAIRAVCDHNLWDVVSMAALVATYASAIDALDREGNEAGDVGEPESLAGRDLVGVARTLHRAGDARRARIAATKAIDRAAHDDDRDLDRLARSIRALVAKREKDVERALEDFHALAEGHADAPARLELAKLYEHRLRDPEEALAHVEAGTSEDDAAKAHRRERLERKIARSAQLSLSKRR
jgi:uncharacterized protein YprB with RNaseH-like and TPR domain